MEIITGFKNVGHVTSAQAGATNTMLYGSGKYVLDVGSKFAATKVDDNTITIADGYGINQGRFFCNSEDTNVVIQTGTAGKYREDLIVARYEKTGDLGIEDVTLAVIKGDEGTEYVEPAYTDGNILDGDTSDDMPLYAVKINGTSIESVEALFSTTTSVTDKVDSITKHIDDTAKELVTPYITEAQQAVTDATAQVTLAEEQVTLATSQATLAQGYAEEARDFTPEGYQDLQTEVAGYRSEVDALTTKVNNLVDGNEVAY